MAMRHRCVLPPLTSTFSWDQILLTREAYGLISVSDTVSLLLHDFVVAQDAFFDMTGFIVVL